MFPKRWGDHRRISRGGKEKYKTRYQYLHAAINKHGVENFEIIELEQYDNKEDVNKAECFGSVFYELGIVDMDII